MCIKKYSFPNKCLYSTYTYIIFYIILYIMFSITRVVKMCHDDWIDYWLIIYVTLHKQGYKFN